MNRLIVRNVYVNGHRTSLRLEVEIWDALKEISLRENQTVHEVCSHIEVRRGGGNRTSAIRAYIVSYFREATENAERALAGHGQASSYDGPLPHLDLSSRSMRLRF